MLLKDHTLVVRAKPRLTLPCDLGAQVMLQKDPELFSVICIFRVPGRIRYCIKWVIMWQCLVLTQIATCHVLGQVTSYFLIGTGDTCYMGFWRNQSWILIVESHFMVNRVRFPPGHVNLKKNFLPTSFWQERIFRCQIRVIPLLLKLIRKTWDKWAEPWQRKQETQPCVCWLLGSRLIQY